MPILSRYHFQPFRYNQERQACQDLLLIGWKVGIKHKDPLFPSLTKEQKSPSCETTVSKKYKAHQL